MRPPQWMALPVPAISALVSASIIAGLPFSMANAATRQPSTPHERTALDIYRTIISYPTSAGNGKLPEMARYLAGKFREAGFPESDIHILPLGETASMVVRYRGDSSGGKPILLMAHMDVVPALSRLITRRVPLARWREAFERRDGDVKVVLDFGA